MNVLDRITFDPGNKSNELNPIPWPDGLAPKPHIMSHSTPMPKDADFLVITWTAAEARALADVLTPGVQSSSWNYYKDNFSEYESLLTNRSPAK
jgi:hypothetical protein